MPTSDRYAFGSFVLEQSQQRVLHSDGTPVSLTPRLFSALLFFIESPGELLDKDSLMAALWPGMVVEENNLNQVVHGLRRALGDDGSRFIQTVPRRGFRFVAPVTALPASVSRPTPHDSGLPVQRRRLYIAAAAGLAATGAGWWALRPPRAAAPAAAGVTLAVLPFKLLTAARDDELLSLGMADSLVARLSAVRGLVVRSTGSVVHYSGAQRDPLRAARELDVAWIVDGSLQRQGDRLRATVRLLRASDGSSAWSGGFDQKVVDVFDVQDQIAARVAQALAPRLQVDTAGTRGQLIELGGTRSIEAYQLYLTANWRGQDGRAESIAKAIALLHRALEIDPEFALAWTLLAWSHRRGLWSSDAVPTEVFRAANAALDRALALAPTLAQARAGLGFSRCWFDFDWAGGERAFRSALALNPNEVSAHHGLGALLVTQDRIEEGLLHYRKALELDPMSPFLNTMEASLLTDYGRLDQARVRLERALDISPQLWLAHVAQALLYFREQDDDLGLAALRRAVELGKGTARPRAMLGVHLARTGRRDEARAILNDLLALSRSRYVPPTSLAAVQAALGDTAAALASLEKAVAVRDTRVVFLKDDPHWRSLQKEPRFVALMARLKLNRYGPGLSPV
jgi:TolB-like protein/DNA-binding winged helix-turn-helix (wHTH) protein/tetratricopeptide (TPR) repeat protein